MNSTQKKYVSMVYALADLFDKTIAELPDEQREIVKSTNLSLKWDDYLPAEREMECKSWDYEHNPATNDERETQFNLYSKQADIEREISSVKMFPENDALQRESKQRQLKELEAELVATQITEPAKQQGESLPDDHWTVKARTIANKIALEKYNRGEREITARNICDAVASELGKDPKNNGTRGPRTAGNIRNVALKGWKFIQRTGINGTNGTAE